MYFKKISFFFNSKLNGRKLGFNTPLSEYNKDLILIWP